LIQWTNLEVRVGISVDLFLGTLLKGLIYNIPQDPPVSQCVRNNLFCPGGRKVGEMVRFADECRASYKNAILALFLTKKRLLPGLLKGPSHQIRFA
jgi:hypothetical protein